MCRPRWGLLIGAGRPRPAKGKVGGDQGVESREAKQKGEISRGVPSDASLELESDDFLLLAALEGHRNLLAVAGLE